jgi:hypothetical protein
MANHARRQGSGESTFLEERARSYAEGAELLRRLIAHGNGLKEQPDLRRARSLSEYSRLPGGRAGLGVVHRRA